MKPILVAIIGAFIVQDCLGQVKSNGLPAAFVAGGNSLPSTSIEGQTTEHLRDIVLNETASYITRVSDDLLRQVNIQSYLQVSVLRVGLENFNYQLEQLPVGAPANSLDLPLQFLNQKIEEAFNLIPQTLGGNAMTKLPKPPKKEKSDSQKSSSSGGKLAVHTLSELLNNLALVLETDLSALSKFQKNLLSAAYKGAGTAYADLQDEFRAVAINKYLVPALKSIVRDIQEKAVIAEAHVSVLLWHKFLALSDQLNLVAANTDVVTENSSSTVIEE
ncbi:uncharacterized protein LOC105692036 [Athalia rosae]|uniref:uncharacterized protein LOC105692036 n=1 Tax=Athalia rosae TaxID=37344 RepID=UPI0020336293|nr:uncharacterized protein LOC105692036 [Athalia rosae]